MVVRRAPGRLKRSVWVWGELLGDQGRCGGSGVEVVPRGGAPGGRPGRFWCIKSSLRLLWSPTSYHGMRPERAGRGGSLWATIDTSKIASLEPRITI